MSAAFDTHQIVKRLQAAGLSEQIAEAVTDAVAAGRSADLSNLTTKAETAEFRAEVQAEFADVRTEMRTEFAALRAEMQAEFAAVRTEMRTEFAKVRSEMAEQRGEIRAELSRTFAETLRWMIGLIVIQGGAVVALLKLLPSH